MEFNSVKWKNVNKICRLCLNKADQMSEIFTTAIDDNLPNVLFKKIISIANIQISADDGFPSSVCTACEKLVEQFYNFQLMVEKSDRTLRCFQPVDDFELNEESSADKILDEIDESNEDEEMVDFLADHLYSMTSPSEDPSPQISNSVDQFIDESNDIDEVSQFKLENEHNTEDLKEELEVEEIYEEGDMEYLDDEETESSKKTFSCQICLCLFNTFDNLKNHVMDHCSEPQKKYFKFTKDSTKSIKEKVDSDDYTSEDDGKEVKTVKDQRAMCKHCNRSLLKINIWKHVIKCRTKTRKFACDECDQVFNKKGELSEHKRIHPSPSLICEKCDKTFSNMQSLIVHVKRHVLGNRYICEICGKGYFAHTELLRHVQNHTDKKRFPCTQCSKAFPTKPELTRHLKYHNGTKKFVCHICGKCYYESGHLKVHMRKHSGERPFICHICSKGFVTKSKVIRHIKIHDKKQIERVYPNKKTPGYY